MSLVPYAALHETVHRALLRAGCPEPKASRLAEIFAMNTAEGSASHGVARLMRFIDNIASGDVNIQAEPEAVARLGGLEVWDGHYGAGPLIAEAAMDRAVELARTQGIACVSVRNSNHWMRPARYGLQAASAGMIGLLLTNTMPNMPPWGAKDNRIGNNPIVIAVPHPNGHVVVDTSMAQYSYGRMEVAKRRGEALPYPGGYDEDGELTTDPGRILTTRRVLPMGYWKGSALSVALDLVSAAVSMGHATHTISPVVGVERGLSQIYIAIHYASVVDSEVSQQIIADALTDYLSVEPLDNAAPLHYPGQRIDETRTRNLRDGVPVDDAIWDRIAEYASKG